MRNRNGTEYSWEKVDDNTFKFVMEGNDLNWCRFGGQEGATTIDNNNLGFFDPSGGPFVSIGYELWDENESTYYKVVQISSTEEGMIVRVEK